MKNTLLSLLLAFLLLPFLGNAQGGTWTWMKGSTSNFGASATYGTQGVPAQTNNPGSLMDPCFWIDLQGNFWVFGGSDLNGYESDMWKFDPINNVWTWIKGPGTAGVAGNYGTLGVAAASNNPGGRGYQNEGTVSWTDLNGNLWMFGGYGDDGNGSSGVLNDLWMYNIATNQWTWENGSSSTGGADVYGTLQVPSTSNTPGARYIATGWVDCSGDFWLFGGVSGNFSGTYSDMWRYNISSNSWTWMSGPQGTNQPGSYGVMGTTSATNLPPSRGTSTHWKDPQGNFYFWGGYYASTDQDYNDVWQYDPTTNYWTWVAGVTTLNSYPGNYNQYCLPNAPGTVGPNDKWDNPSPQMLGASDFGVLIGGESESQEVPYNDLWTFDHRTNQFNWITGTSQGSDLGNYGTLGVPASTNLPPARKSQAAWIDLNGNYWLFGGATESGGYFNDMWEFTPLQSCIGGPLTGSISYTFSTNVINSTICKGDSAIITFKGLTNGTITPAPFITWIDSNHAYMYPDTTTTFTITGHTLCPGGDTTRVTLYVNKPGSFNYTVSDTQLCQGNSSYVALYGLIGASISPSSSVIWQDAAHAILNPVNTTNYTIISQSSVCLTPDTSNFTVHVTNYNPIDVTPLDTVVCYGNSIVVHFTGLSSITVSPSYYSVWLDSVDVQLSPYSNMVFNVSAATSCGSSYSTSINLKVNYPGTLNYTLAPRAVCQGDTAQLTLSGLSPVQITPLTGITWTTPNTNALVSPSTTTTYFIAGIDAVCNTVDTASVTMFVEQPGTISFTVDSVICPNGYSYLYIYGATNLSIRASDSSYVYLYQQYQDTVDWYAYLYPYATTTYTFTGTNVCGQQVSETFTISVSNGGYFTLASPIVCRGDSDLLTLHGFATVAVTPANYVTWIDASNALLSPDSNTTFTITGTTVCGGSYFQPIGVDVTGPVASAYNIGPDSICATDSSQLCCNAISPEGPIVSYNWNTGQTGTCIEALFAGTYYATVTDQSGCKAVSAGVTIAVKPNPPVTVSVNGDTLTAYNSPYYQWYFNGQEIFGANNNVYIATKSGNYSVSVINTDNCRASSNPIPIVATGLVSINRESGINVYPNPTSGSWNVEVGATWIGSEYEIYDADGRLLRKSEIRDSKAEINGDFASGIYVIKIHNETNNYITRLIRM